MIKKIQVQSFIDNYCADPPDKQDNASNHVLALWCSYHQEPLENIDKLGMWHQSPIYGVWANGPLCTLQRFCFTITPCDRRVKQ